MMEEQLGTGASFNDTDFDVINHRRLRYLELHSPEEIDRFKHTPIFVTEKVIRDAINKRTALAFASTTNCELVCYRSHEFGPRKSELPRDVQRALWCLPSNQTEDTL